jgi:hypothetical protein
MAEIRKGEVLPVPPEMAAQLWTHVKTRFESVPDLNIERLYSRLLLGADKLWVAVEPVSVPGEDPFLGVILTTVSDEPPTRQKVFERLAPANRRSLAVHLAEGRKVYSWIESAVERITEYGKQERCRMLFIKASRAWRRYATRFYSRDDWQVVAFSRDRATAAKRVFKRRNTPGFYLVMQPVASCDWKRQLYNNGTRCYFEERVV